MKKASRYNHFIMHNNSVIAYNARTNALAELEKEIYESFKKCSSNHFKGMDTSLLDSLEYGGFIVDEDINELDIVKHNMYLSRFSTQQLGLTIAPTSNCNFRCPYCYEKDVLRSSKMNDETANGIVNLVRNNANTINMLGVTWYGGEPLLEVNRIENLTKAFKEICNKNNVKYQANIVTNGYLLDKKMILRLIDLDITSIQITLDGTKEYHDQTRYLIWKKPTFDTIIKNLLSCNDIRKEINDFPKITIRMNINRANYEGCEKLLILLHKNKIDEFIDFYPAIVTDPDDIDFKEVYTVEEFEKIKKEVELKKNKIEWRFQNTPQYPDLKGNWCVCDMYNSFVIDSDGEIYKCWELMGNKNNSIGNISDHKSINYNSDYYKNLLEDPTINDTCSNCDILPICNGGGCTIYRKNHKYKPTCKFYKDTLIKQVIDTFDNLQDNIDR